MTGDGDYYDVLKYLLEKKQSVRLISTTKSSASDLRILFGANFIQLNSLRHLIEYVDVENKNKDAETTNVSASGIVSEVYTKRGYLSSKIDKQTVDKQVLPFRKGGIWTKVSDLQEGDMLAVSDLNGKAIYEKVEKIELLPPEQVYDIEVENTHNFIGNDIVAHNTYINGATTILGTTLINSTGTSATTIGNATGVLTIASGGTSSWTNTSGNLTIQTATSGTMTVDSVGILNLGTTNSTATNLGKALTTLTINPISWTATPTISGLVTMTSGFDSNSASTASSLTLDANTGTALTISGTTFATDILLQNGESIDNDTDGTILFTATTSKTSGDLYVGASGTGAITSGLINSQTISSAASFTGTVQAATSFLAPTFDTATAVALNISTTTQSALTLGRVGSTTAINGSTITAGGATTTAFTLGNITSNPTLSRYLAQVLPLTRWKLNCHRNRLDSYTDNIGTDYRNFRLDRQRHSHGGSGIFSNRSKYFWHWYRCSIFEWRYDYLCQQEFNYVKWHRNIFSNFHWHDYHGHGHHG